MRHVFSEMYERRQTNRIINNLYHRVEERNEGLDRGKRVGSVPRLKAIKIFFKKDEWYRMFGGDVWAKLEEGEKWV